jgi:hypothetical protein
MEQRVEVERPVQGFFTRLGLLFRKFGDIRAPEKEVGFTLPDALNDIRNASVAGQLPEVDVYVWDAMVEDMMSYAARQVKRADYDGQLTESDLVAVLLYTCEFPDVTSFYVILNQKLNEPDRNHVKPFVRYIWMLLRALVKCPVSPCRLVYRGIKNSDLTPHYLKDQEFEWHQFSSCSCSIEVQNQFTGRVGVRTLFTIELTSSRGRDVSKYSALQREKEVLLPPNTKFRVTGSFDTGNGLKMIQVVEIPATDAIISFQESVACVPMKLMVDPSQHDVKDVNPIPLQSTVQRIVERSAVYSWRYDDKRKCCVPDESPADPYGACSGAFTPPRLPISEDMIGCCPQMIIAEREVSLVAILSLA